MTTDRSVHSLDPSQNFARYRLKELRLGLLRLHKTLLDAERLAYERVHGRVSNNKLLQLAIGDEQFGWLHLISKLVVQIDEALKADEPVSAIEADRYIDAARTLLNPSETGTHFQQQYHNALQQEPDVLIAHVAMSQLLSKDALS